MNKEIREFIEDEIRLEHIPGAVLLASLQDKVICHEAYGYRTVFPSK